MTPQELRNSILQLAYEGRLCNDLSFNAEDLYSLIQNQKKILSKTEGLKFKKTDALNDEDKPYDLPANWKWVRLCDVFYLIPTGVERFKGLKKYFSTGSVDGSSLVPEGEYTFDNRPSRANREHIPGDLLDAKMQKTLKTLIINEELSVSLFSTGFYGLRVVKGNIKHLKFFIESPYYQTTKNSQCSGTTQKAINDDKLMNIPFPLAPLEVQNLIVAKIEELLSLVDRYELLWKKLEKFNHNFPIEMEKSLMKYAFAGKLVEQIENEGTGDELLKKLISSNQKKKKVDCITEDDEPFSIPESWVWCPLEAIVSKKIKRGKSPKYTNKSGTLVFAQKCNTKKGIIDLSLAKFLDETIKDKYSNEEYMVDSDIVLNSTGGGTLGRVGVYHDSDNVFNLPVVPDSHVTIIRPSSLMDAKYVFYVLKYYQPYLESLGEGSTNQTELAPSVVASLLFPLPPYKEQKRIVAKLEELLPLCRKLVK